ncbi:hypothetical protein SCLCIDRAFT_373311 [Scleroderma citrinum Foug A]|uniref:Uncharacterized protein n=1 Tax=Scleroderma citrinum Foug A TaxID=1036808 RepID=A0A0C2ZPH9_9AGAM|nr:hypothetical protein SCLCIDRAFT_373311 [Scleroderma citrinum Foug A]
MLRPMLLTKSKCLCRLYEPTVEGSLSGDPSSCRPVDRITDSPSSVIPHHSNCVHVHTRLQGPGGRGCSVCQQLLSILPHLRPGDSLCFVFSRSSRRSTIYMWSTGFR